MQGAIVVTDLGKRFRQAEPGRPSTLKATLLSGYRRTSREHFWGLRHISFGVRKGRSVGVVGRNGAGKSTLLRLIGGVGRPDEGKIVVQGRIGALLEIGAGLTDDLTGRENIFLLGVIAGMLKAEVAARFEAIATFSELGQFLDNPVRTYSTGMKMRLAFSVAAHIEPDILLIDEVLTVGDLAFQAKCLARIEALKARGCTIFLVSHDSSQIRSLCDDALFLKAGRVIAYGPVQETMSLFESSMDDGGELPGQAERDDMATASAGSETLERGVNRFGSGPAEITRVVLLRREGGETAGIAPGEALVVRFDIASQPASEVIAVVGIYAADETACFESASEAGGGQVIIAESRPQTISVVIDRLDLAPGRYFATVGLFSPDWQLLHDYHAEAYPFTVSGVGGTKGYLNPPLRWEVPSPLAGQIRS